MNSSAGDNSTAKTVNPFAPPPEPFHPPRLGIIHLLAWTAVTAVLLKISMAAGWLDSPTDELPRALRIFFTTTTSIYTMVLAAGVVGTSVIFRACLRGVPGRLQAGHWMLVTATVVTVFALPFWLVIPIAETYLDSEFSSFIFYSDIAVQSAAALLEAVLWLLATIRMREAFRWKALLGFFVVRDATLCIIYLGAIFSYSLFDLASLPVGAAIGLLALPLVVLIDLWHCVQRDWLHWLGVAIIITFEVLSIAQFLAMKLLY